MEQVVTSENKPERDEHGRLLPGNTANPNGRPKGSLSITAEIKKKLEEIPEGQKRTYLELLVSRIIKQAIVDGDQQTIKQIWNYVDGMPRQNIGLDGGEDFSKILVEIVNGTQTQGDNPTTKE